MKQTNLNYVSKIGFGPGEPGAKVKPIIMRKNGAHNKKKLSDKMEN